MLLWKAQNFIAKQKIILKIVCYSVIYGLAGLLNARRETCLDLGIKSRRVNKWAINLCLSYQTEVRGG